MVPGFVCGSGLIGDNICRFGSVGQASIPCAERIDWLQPLKPTFNFLGSSVSCVSGLPSYLLGFTEKSILNVSLMAIGEELVCRGLVQNVLMRKLQKKIVVQFSKNEALVDHPIMKISRIAAASIIFGLMHTRVWECGYGGTIPEIAGGIIFGILAETKYGLVGSSLAHTAANLIIG
jgi:membrane protease YdiL (CAAX protease family)